MNDISLKLDPRDAVGKKVAKLRQDGFVPSVVYGGKTDAKSTQSPYVETTKVVQAAGRHTPVHLTIDGKKKLAIVKSIDVDPVKHLLRHVSFHTIKQNEKITTEVPIALEGEGESEAEKAGLVVLQALEYLEVRALPLDLPDSLKVSIAGLEEAGNRVLVRDIVMPKGVEIVDNDDGREDTEDDENTILDLVVANVYEPSALQAANDSAGGDAEEDDEVESDNGGDSPQDIQAEETMPGGKSQEQPKQSNIDANQE